MPPDQWTQQLQSAHDRAFNVAESAHLRYANSFDARLRALLAVSPPVDDVVLDYEGTLALCIKTLEGMDFTADDLRFILVFITMCWGKRPAVLFAQIGSTLAGDALPAGSPPASSIPSAGNPA